MRSYPAKNTTTPGALALLLACSLAGLPACSSDSVELYSVSPATGSARGGEVVVLSGAGFADGATVRFGAVDCTRVEVLSKGALQVTTPASLAGNVEVTVRNPDGRVAFLAGGFTFAPLDLRFVEADPQYLPDLGDFTVKATAAADFDGDGDNDLLLAGANGPSRILVGSGTGSFEDRSSAEAEEGAPALLPAWQNDTREVVVEDFDGDGDPDIFACNSSGAANRLFANEGVAGFTDISADALPLGTDACQRATAADVDADGRVDVVTVASDRGTSARHLRAYLNRSDETSLRFELAEGLHATRDMGEAACGEIHTSAAAVSGTCTFAAGGADDSAASGHIHYEVTAEAGDLVVARFAVPSIADAPVALDLSVRGNASGHHLYLEVEDASGEIFSTSPGRIDWSGWRALRADDIAGWEHAGGNADGILDAPVARVGVGLTSAGGATTGDLHVDGIELVMTSAGRCAVEDFERHDHLLSWTDGMSSIAAADTDLDGDDDIVLSSTTSGEGAFLRLLENRSSVAQEGAEVEVRFVEQAPHTMPALTESISQVVTVDVDGDWDRDLVAISGSGQDRLLVNDSAGFFFDATVAAMPVDRVDGRRAAAADLDMDGRADLVIANYGEVNRLYLGREDGSFSDKTPALPLDSKPSTQVLVFDADSDGDLDILVINGGGEAAQLLVSVAAMPANRRAKSGSAPAGPDLLLTLPWGDSGAAAGRIDGDEASSEGPMSFTVARDGSIYILDQVNLRVLVFRANGSLSREIPIASATYQDISVTANGTILLLDRLVASSLVLLDQRGGLLAEHDVIGDGIPEGGGITAMFARADGVWLEFGHAYVVRVLDADLQPAERVMQPGRIFADGKRNVGAAIDRQGGAKVWLGHPGNGTVQAMADLRLEHDIARIAWIEADQRGYLHVMLHELELDATYPQQVNHEQVVGLRFDMDLRQVGSFTSPHVITELEQFREFRVTEDGSVYQMAFGKEGVSLYRWQW